ncbi:MAG: AAA family ATPase [Alphaproteobacteria bacterium]|nr:AAA family ATPase [Alphaproteobacteria bacterium]
MPGQPRTPIDVVELPECCAIRLRLTRDTEAATRSERQTYRLIPETGGLSTPAVLAWDEEMRGLLSALRRGTSLPHQRNRLAERLASFLDPLGWAVTEARVEDALRQGLPVDLTVCTDAIELFALPWELVPLPRAGVRLGQAERVLLRYTLDRGKQVEPATLTEPGRLLVAWSDAGGAVPHTEHVAAIAQAAQDGGVVFDPNRDVVPRATPETLREALRAAGPPVLALHLLCHGRSIGEALTQGLVLGRPGAELEVTGPELRQLLAPSFSLLRLVVLAACSGGGNPAFSYLTSNPALELHWPGVEAVVGTRFPIRVDASTALCEALWGALLRSRAPVEDAVRAAQAALASRFDAQAWAGLQLYHRTRGGLRSRVAWTAPDAAPVAPTRFERRLLVYMAAHAWPLSGESLPVEALSRGVDAFQEQVREVAQAWGGHITQAEGLRAVLRFGLEDDVRPPLSRGADAAIDLRDRMRSLDRRDIPALIARIGLNQQHTFVELLDPPVVRGIGANLAEDLAALAPDATIAISSGVHDALAGQINTLPLPLPEGARVTQAHKLIALVPAAPAAPLLGRELQLRELDARWREAAGGRGQAALFTGGKGIGKTRLVSEFARKVVARGGLVIEGHGYADRRATPLHVFIDALEQSMRLGRDLNDPQRILLLRDTLSRAGLAHLIPTISAILNPNTRDHRPSNASAASMRDERAQAIWTWLKATAARAPVLLVLEDLHWADRSTLEAIGTLLPGVSQLPLLVIMTWQTPWEKERGPPAEWSPIDLQQRLQELSEDDARALVAALTEGAPLDPDDVDDIVARAGGVPLLLEHLVKVPPGGALTDNLVGVVDGLLSRIEGDALSLLYDVAVLGADFDRALLRDIATPAPDRIDAALRALVSADILVHKSGVGGGARFGFRHPVTGEVAYNRIPDTERRVRHARIAAVLDGPGAERTPFEVIARHLEASGAPEAAVDRWMQAARLHLIAGANAEAIDALESVLGALAKLPDDPPRHIVEIRTRSLLGPLYMERVGYAAQVVEQTYARARTLLPEIEDPELTFQVRWGICAYELARGAYKEALEMGQSLLETAQATQAPPQLLYAHTAVGVPLYYLAHYVEALEHLAAVPDVATLEVSHGPAALMGPLPAVVAFAYRGLAVFLLGRPDEAMALFQQTRHQVDALGHPFSDAVLVACEVVLYLWRGEPEVVNARAAALSALIETHRFGGYAPLAEFFQWWSDAQLAPVPDPMSAMLGRLEKWQETGTDTLQPLLYAVIAEFVIAQDPAQAHQWVDSALALLDAMESDTWRSELLRIRAKALRQQGQTDAAREVLEQALGVAEAQSAATLALRVTADTEGILDPEAHRALVDRWLAAVDGGDDIPWIAALRASG